MITPGPWKYVEECGAGEIIGEGPNVIALGFDDGLHIDNPDDLALILASPELFRFVEDVARMAEHQFRTCKTVGSTSLFYKLWQDAQATIDKAKRKL